MSNCKVILGKGNSTCLEHISPKSAREAKSTASEKEWQAQTGVRYLLADAQRAEPDSATNLIPTAQRVLIQNSNNRG